MSEKISGGPAIGLTELIDKGLPVSMLGSALARERLGGTLLFFGPDGGGKSSLAFWLAAALNCAESRGLAAGCGNCNSCRKIANLNHPDVIWVFPVPGSIYKAEQPDQAKLAQVFEEKRKNPWCDIQFAEKSEHHLAAVNRIRQEASRSCYEGRRKVFVITGADRLRLEAANAFLKLLEEPRPDVTLILCSDRPSSLLPTILSRCQRLQVNRPRLSTLAGLLAGRFAMAESEARELLELADGNLPAALRLREEEALQNQREWVDKTFRAVLVPGAGACLVLVEDRRGPMFNRGDFERYLAGLIRELRDALMLRVAGKEALSGRGKSIVDTGPVAEFAGQVADFQTLIKLLFRLIDLRDALNRNVNLRLLGWSLMKNMKEVLQ